MNYASDSINYKLISESYSHAALVGYTLGLGLMTGYICIDANECKPLISINNSKTRKNALFTASLVVKLKGKCIDMDRYLFILK